MVTPEQVRSVALSLPGTGEEDDRFAFFVVNKGKKKGIAWVWLERINLKKPRVPNPNVLAVRVLNVDWKEAYIASNPNVYFTEPHYNGYPAVLVRLEHVGLEELTELLREAWRIQAPNNLVANVKGAP